VNPKKNYLVAPFVMLNSFQHLPSHSNRSLQTVIIQSILVYKFLWKILETSLGGSASK